MSSEETTKSDIKRVPLEDPSEAPIDAVRESVVRPDRKNVINRPGALNVAASHGNYPGCKMLLFYGVEEVNDFFAKHSNLLVVDIRAVQLADKVAFTVLYTNQLEGQEMRALELYGRELRAKVEEMIEEERLAEEKGTEDERARIEEVNALAADGRKYRALKNELRKKARKMGLDPEKIEKELKMAGDEVPAALENGGKK